VNPKKHRICPRQLLPGETEEEGQEQEEAAANDEDDDSSSSTSTGSSEPDLSDVDTLVVLEQLSTKDLSNKVSFVHKNGYVFYAWDQLEKHDLLRVSLRSLMTVFLLGPLVLLGWWTYQQQSGQVCHLFVEVIAQRKTLLQQVLTT
jgi:hypothetical protein